MTTGGLLDRDRLRQIARLIDIAAAADGDVIGQQLARHDFQNRHQQFRCVGNVEDVIGGLANLFVAFGGDGDYRPGTGFHFLQIRQRFLVTQHRVGIVLVVRSQDHHWQVFVDQRIGTVLHLARRIAFGVNVGDFLQLQSAFQRDGVMNAASKKEEIVGAVIFLRQVLGLFIAGQQRLQLGGNARQLFQQLLGTSPDRWCRELAQDAPRAGTARSIAR